MSLMANQNAEATLWVSILTIVLTNLLPAVVLSVVIWIFWRARHRE
jgi:hypothetical protein